VARVGEAVRPRRPGASPHGEDGADPPALAARAVIDHHSDLGTEKAQPGDHGALLEPGSGGNAAGARRALAPRDERRDLLPIGHHHHRGLRSVVGHTAVRRR